jgi:cytochrome b
MDAKVSDKTVELASNSVPVVVPVWDLPVRLFHWLLVLCVTAAAITGYLLPATWLQIHIVAGSAIGALVLLRLIWGFTGTRYSRFRSFTFSPAETVSHLKDLLAGTAPREAGHNPLAALMIFALLAVLSFIVISGLAVLGGQFKQGPLKAFLSFATGNQIKDLHSLFAAVLLALIGGHVGGVIFESWRTRENLARAMVTGKKRGGFAHELPRHAVRAGLALGAAGLLAVILVPAGSALMAMPPKGIVPHEADPAWKEECGACHMAFHPSLLPVASWTAIMGGLDRHFGEDASLDADKTKQITAFLVSHSAETQDSLPANVFRRVNPERPMEITATRFWQRKHDGIPASVFAMKQVGAKQNCGACHGDAASGMFAPQAISIPMETSL